MATSSNVTHESSSAVSPHRDWIAVEFSKGIHAEHEMGAEARLRAANPPDASLGVLFSQIAEADERHCSVIETVAVRYGHTPARSLGGGIGQTLSKLKDKVTSIGSSPLDCVSHDLSAKANAIHWYEAWVHAFTEIGDSESARELAAILTEERSHRDALQDVLNRLVVKGSKGGDLELGKS